MVLSTFRKPKQIFLILFTLFTISIMVLHSFNLVLLSTLCRVDWVSFSNIAKLASLMVV